MVATQHGRYFRSCPHDRPHLSRHRYIRLFTKPTFGRTIRSGQNIRPRSLAVCYQTGNFTIPASDERYRLLVFHRHTSEGLAKISRLPLFLKTPQENRNEFEYTGKALHQAPSIKHV